MKPSEMSGTPHRFDLDRMIELRRRVEQVARELGFVVGDVDTYEKADHFTLPRIVIELLQDEKPQ
jgi:hypothetical protein